MAELVLALVMLLVPVLAGGDHAEPGFDRKRELHALLDRAIVLHRTRSRLADEAGLLPRSGATSELDLDLAHMELAGGYLERGCVCEPSRVRALRRLVTYVRVMRLLGRSPSRIREGLLARAGAHAGQLEQLIDFVGLEGISHLICFDYLRARLADGMDEPSLRAYVEAVGSERPLEASL